MNNFKEKLKNYKLKEKNITFFDFVAPQEMLVSSWLSFILDPSKNGLINGNQTISLLLELIDNKPDVNIDNLEFISTKTEVVNVDKKRMDIIIKYSGLWIVIENKIDSWDGGSTTNYYNEIEKIKDNNEVIYIYLKPEYNKSSPKNKNFQTITYERLINKLNTICKNDYKEPYKFKYLNEFRISGEKFMKNYEIQFDENIIFYLENKDTIKKLQEEYETQNYNLHKKIFTSIQSNLEEEYTSHITNTYIQIYKEYWQKNNYAGIHFEIMFAPGDALGRKEVKLTMTLHIEGKTTDKELSALKELGFKKGKGNVARINNSEIKVEKIYNFSNIQNIETSVEDITKEMTKIINDYSKKIDSIYNL
ncbi:MAG: PD-(D/E)XK nuclease family protein [Clostridia bacterium]|nr:PD-(D/E)XK nuclease family protein [Clostridia bacterium]